MSLLKKTRLQLLANQNANGSPALDNLADVAAHFNQLTQTNATLTEALLQLNTEAAATESQIITKRIPDFVSTGVFPFLVVPITITQTGPGNVYQGNVALDITNTGGAPADINFVVIGTGSGGTILLTFGPATLGAGATTTLRLAMEATHNTPTTVNVTWVSATILGTPVAVGSGTPTPASPVTVTEGDILFNLSVDLDADLGIIGDGFFGMEANVGTIENA